MVAVPTEPITMDTTTTQATTEPQAPLGSFQNPANSCRDIPQDSPSGEYYIQTGSNPPIQVYCDTNRTSCSCNATGGWTRIVNIDMTDPNQNCPDGFELITRTEPPLRTCGMPGGPAGCVSATFPVHGIEYSHVCGRIVSYQIGSPDAFYNYVNRGQTIDGYYLYGFSLTHGFPRQHIWSFVGAVAEGFTDSPNICPCIINSDTGTVPSFVGSDYFCDTAAGDDWPSGVFYPDDPLWDGQGCGGSSTCCEFNNPPWFCKQLPQSTTDDIELRICQAHFADDTPFEVVEMFIS